MKYNFKIAAKFEFKIRIYKENPISGNELHTIMHRNVGAHSEMYFGCMRKLYTIIHVQLRNGVIVNKSQTPINLL